MNIRQYFDLSEPVTLRTPKVARPTSGAPRSAPTASSSAPITLVWQIVIYLLLVLSIVASRFLDLYRAGVASSFALDLRYLMFIGIVSLLAFPVVYDKARFNKDQPIFLQIAVIFTAGMGWEKIVATAIGK